MRSRIGSCGRCPGLEVWNECHLHPERVVGRRSVHLPALRHVQTGEILMTPASLALIATYLLVMLVLVKPLGLYIANVMEGRPIWALRAGAEVERLIYRLSGVDTDAEMGWRRYTIALLLFNAVGALAVYALQRLQLWLPL